MQAKAHTGVEMGGAGLGRPCVRGGRTRCELWVESGFDDDAAESCYVELASVVLMVLHAVVAETCGHDLHLDEFPGSSFPLAR